jgi:hypothetical protein
MQSNKKLTISHAHDLASLRNGKCLSATYINIDSKLTWECESGHQWQASYYNVNKHKSWCPHCAGNARLSLEAMKKSAQEKGGKCLSTSYIHSNIKLLWECEFGHRWDALPGPIRSKGVWCPICSGTKKLTIKDMHELAEKRKGKCISTEYINNRRKLKWECEIGHKWEATPTSVCNNESWCPECAGTKKLTIEDMMELAKNKHGKCLSKEYINITKKLAWQCQHGHQWEAVGRDIKNGKWCPECYRSKRKGENAVRKFFEKIFNNKFPSSKPSWLAYQGQRLELDGYCKDLKIAFEYQGKYHFDEKAYWYPDKTTSFERRQVLDLYKIKICEEKKIKLIQINELNPGKNPLAWKDEIKSLLINNGLDIPSNYDDISFGAVEFHTSNNHTQEAHDVAESKNGISRSENVLYRSQLVDWECHLGHRWSASLSQITLRHTWCPYCANRARLTIERMQEQAKLRGGRCLSINYLNMHKKLLWECHLGHQWKAIPSSIMNHGTWCPACSGNTKQTIEDMKKLARERNGECLSKEYKGNKEKLVWKCEKGHTWGATPSSISNHETWCPICGGSFKLTITEMQKLAKSMGGKCLSTTYINARTKLLWECHAGHQWLAVPDKIKNLGRWCRPCSKLTRSNGRSRLYNVS